MGPVWWVTDPDGMWAVSQADSTPEANLVLTEAIERIFVRDVYADIPRGMFLVRGENVLLLGEIVGTRAQLRLDAISKGM